MEEGGSSRGRGRARGGAVGALAEEVEGRGRESGGAPAPGHGRRRRKAAVTAETTAGPGAFAMVLNVVRWLAIYFVVLMFCMTGFTNPPQPSPFVLLDGCAAGAGEFIILSTAIFMCTMSCTGQACIAGVAMMIMGSEKRLDRLPVSGCTWCCRALLVGVFFCTLSFTSLIVIFDCSVFVRMGRFVCLGWVTRSLVVAVDAMAGLVAMAIFLVGTYVSLYCQ